MNRYKGLFYELLTDETGQDLIEYALVAGLIAVAGIISFGNFDTKVKAAFNSIGSQLTNAL
jgi:pilus assembly protein Flp/PilA